MTDELPRWASLLISALLMAPFLVALFIFVRHSLRRRSWTWVEATVTGTRTETSQPGNGPTRRTTTVTYVFTDATMTERTGTTVNPEGEPRRGAVLQIMYDPRNPDRSGVAAVGKVFVLAMVVFFALFALGVGSVFAPRV